ncbi:MAG: serine/threonine protein kinase, partial [Lentisphaeraceae bacterium]|nr:serine/threonine protein kinase [Lentisphaeraceae bacterium]
PSIINTHNFGIDEEFGPYSVMDWVEGETLHCVLKKIRLGVSVYKETFTLPKLLKYYLDICKALSFAHSKDIIHLDIKPENILIDYEKDKVFLYDWGLAKAFSPLENFNIDPLLLNYDTKAGYFRGTPGYMPPEQISEQTKNMKTDIYQLGALLYTMLFKHCPVEGDNVEEILSKTLAGEIFVDSINEEQLPLIAICKKAMHPNPDERYPDVRSIINEVKKVKLPSTEKKNRFLSLALAALLPFIFLISAFLLVDERGSDLKRVEITEEYPLTTAKESQHINNLLTSEDIALLEEFTHYGAENSEKPLFMIDNPVPVWYIYLDDLIKNQLGAASYKDLDLMLKIEKLISFYKTEEKL